MKFPKLPFFLTLLSPSVAEINVGIVCACVPVVFPLFKSMSNKSSSKWNSWRHYLLKSWPTSKLSRELSTAATEITSPAQRGLPGVPKGNLNTLLSFVKGSRHATQNSVEGQKSQQSIVVTRATDIEMTPYSELRTIDADNMYHSHLYQSGLHTNLAGSYANVSRV